MPRTSTKPKNTTVKKTTTKKTTTPRKSTVAKKTIRKQSAIEKKLVKKLSAILPELDAEGLQFLIEQSEVHLYNMKVIALQEEKQKNATSAKSKSTGEGFSVVRSEDGKVYHIVCEGKYTMFNDEEMLSIIRIAKSRGTTDDKKQKLYHWFFIERRDFLNSHGLNNLENPLWENLISMIKKNFKISGT